MMLDFLLGIGIVFVFFVLGSTLHSLGVPIPSGVLGMILFYAGLRSGLVKLKWVERAAAFLLRHMVLLFIPLTVGLMDMGHLFSRQLWIICTSIALSFLAVLFSTGLLGRRLLAYSHRGSGVENA